MIFPGIEIIHSSNILCIFELKNCRCFLSLEFLVNLTDFMTEA